MTHDKQPTQLLGLDLLKNAHYNKSTAFTEEERDRYRLRGLLPAAVSTQAVQIQRVLENLRRKSDDIERYVFLMALQSRNERLFYRLLIDHSEEVLPIVYTPTVGQACLEFAHIFRQPRGFYITAKDRGRIAEILKNWPEQDVRMIVVTDGERILGLGDLGANGMGIPIGKLALYSAFGGIPPQQCLPVMLDVGTNNEQLRNDPLYLGINQARISGADYLALADEFVAAIQKAYPQALIQFEDFLTPNAYGLLNRYRDQVLCFNDDIQGTAAVALAGVLTSCRLSGIDFSELRIMFLGAGSAATGIADLMQAAMLESGLSSEQARERLSLVDINGLVVNSRLDLAPHNKQYARDHAQAGFLEAIAIIKPHVLIGATGVHGAFTEAVVRLMAKINHRPVIFALSNPTSCAECTAEDVYRWSEGRAIFASGSPYAPVTYRGQSYRPGQCNNAYVFPGIGLGAIAANVYRISNEMFLVAARVLADSVSDKDLSAGTLYPPLSIIRQVSLNIAIAVADKAYEQNLSREPRPADLAQTIEQAMYDPSY